jgi:hypothetical protein
VTSEGVKFYSEEIFAKALMLSPRTMYTRGSALDGPWACLEPDSDAQQVATVERSNFDRVLRAMCKSYGWSIPGMKVDDYLPAHEVQVGGQAYRAVTFEPRTVPAAMLLWSMEDQDIRTAVAVRSQTSRKLDRKSGFPYMYNAARSLHWLPTT